MERAARAGMDLPEMWRGERAECGAVQLHAAGCDECGQPALTSELSWLTQTRGES